MKLLILIGLLLVGPGILLAQTFHAIIVADTRDQSLGSSSDQDLATMSQRLSDIAAKLHLPYHQVVCNNEKFGKQGLMQALAEIKCQPSDIIVFYYTGHGFTNSVHSSNFPVLDLKDDRNTELEAIHQQLKAKKARFCLTLGDCCNNVVEEYRSFQTQPLFKGVGVTPDLSILQQLFMLRDGDVLVSSAQKGEKAIGHRRLGSFYSNSWMEALTMAESNNRNISWESFLKDAENRLQQTLIIYPAWDRHHSQWVINLREAANPVPSRETVQYSDLNQFLNTLINEKDLKFDQRNALRKEQQSQFFEPDATVEIYIDNPEKPVERTTVDLFLKKIVSTAGLIDQLNVVERMSKFSPSGKYQLITLQEVR